MFPERVHQSVKNLPNEVLTVCRQQTWVQLASPPPGNGMRSIHEILVHLIDAEAGWINHVVRGRPRQRVQAASFNSLEEIAQTWLPQREATLSWVQSLTATDLASTRPLPWNSEETASVEEILWHFVTHEHYHRGQIFTRLALLGRRDLPDHDLLRQGASS
jgi:uncharacterized damage-inducible protein DinB